MFPEYASRPLEKPLVWDAAKRFMRIVFKFIYPEKVTFGWFQTM